MDTDAARELKELRDQNGRLKRLLAEAVGGAVAALMVVEGVAPVDDHSLRMDRITEMVAGQHFPFQRGEERLRGSIVETLTG